MPWTNHPKVTAARSRSGAVDVAVGAADGFRRHISSRNAAALAYWAVLTIFPLLLAATTVLGLVLESRPELRDDIVDSALSQIPVVGAKLAVNEGAIGGSWWALVIGLLVALWGSMKAFVGLQVAFDDAWEIDVDERSSAAIQRGRALIGITVIGLAQVGTVVLAALVAEADLPVVGRIGIIAGTLATNVVVVAAMYRFLTSKETRWAMVWPGAVIAGTAYTALQMVGTQLMTRWADPDSVYGDFAGIIALLGWFSIHALFALVGAEINTAIDARRTRTRQAPGTSVRLDP